MTDSPDFSDVKKKIVARVTKFNANQKDLPKDLERNEKLIDKIKKSWVFNEESEELLGEWSGLEENILEAKRNFTKVKDLFSNTEACLGNDANVKEQSTTHVIMTSSGERDVTSKLVTPEKTKETDSKNSVDKQSENHRGRLPSNENSMIPLRSNNDPPKSIQRTSNRRCGKCLACKGTCDTAQRDPSGWCDLCKKKKLGENTENRSCKKRQDCSEQKSEAGKKPLSSSTESSKRKPEKSPDDKSKSKKVHAGGDESTDGEDFDSAASGAEQ